MESGSMDKVKKSFDANSDVLRYLIIKTVRENTLLNGKMKLRKEENRTASEPDTLTDVSEGEAKEVAPEELDKSIDELVIV
jgi:hypothetical protein